MRARAILMALLLGACTRVPVASPEAAAEAPPPPGAAREFGIQRPIDTAPPIAPPHLGPLGVR